MDTNIQENLGEIDTLDDNMEKIDETESQPVHDNECLESITTNNSENIEENLEQIDIFDLNLENDLDSMTLKKPNQIYFELYKEARNKAKLAKKTALLAFLEAKNIKKTYMLENFNDSDSDIDAEIDEVSESELDGL